MALGYRLLASCRIKDYHVFEFDSSRPCDMAMRMSTTFTEVKYVKLLTQGGTEKFQAVSYTEIRSDPKFSGSSPDLSLQISKNHGTRKA